MSEKAEEIAPVADASIDSMQESALRNLLPHVLGLFVREPALGITVAYLFVAMAGIFYVDRFYQRFNIPVLSLSQISDFLTAGVQRPITLLLVLSTLLVIALFDWLNVRSRRRYRRAFARLAEVERPSWLQRLHKRWLTWQLFRGHWYMYLAYAGVLVGYGWVFVSLYADEQVRRIQQGQAQQVRVWTSDGQVLAPSDGDAWRYLGAISNYVFVYDGASRHAQILPVQSIGRIEPVDAAKAVKTSRIVPIAPIP